MEVSEVGGCRNFSFDCGKSSKWKIALNAAGASSEFRIFSYVNSYCSAFLFPSLSRGWLCRLVLRQKMCPKT